MLQSFAGHCLLKSAGCRAGRPNAETDESGNAARSETKWAPRLCPRPGGLTASSSPYVPKCGLKIKISRGLLLLNAEDAESR